MEGGFSRAGEGEMVDRGTFFLQEVLHFFHDFLHRNIFFSYKCFLRGLPDLAIDTVVGADFVRNEVNSKRPSQSSGRDWTIEMTITLHCRFEALLDRDAELDSI